MRAIAPTLHSLSTLSLIGVLSFSACTSSKDTGTAGGPVTGAVDAHCATAQVTSEAACHPTPDTGATTSAGATTTTGATTGAGGATGATTGAGGATGAGGDASDYGVTLFNAEGDDDDCKYHLAWTATDIYENQDVTFTVVGTTKTDGKPLVGGALYADITLNDTHPAPNSGQKVTESPSGTYTVGPVRFDAPGKWTVRFHIHEECSDLTEDSPHGHVAFYVNVP